MIDTTSTADAYEPGLVRSRYVRAPLVGGGRYAWCEVGDDRRYDLRQGRCDAFDLPDDVRQAADVQRASGVWPYYVEWPLGG